MSSVYSFSAAGTATGVLDLERVAAEIETNNAILAACEGGVVVDGAVLELHFGSSLSGPELAALAAVVAAHVPGTGPGPGPEPATALTDTNVIFDGQGRLVYDSKDRVLVTR